MTCEPRSRGAVFGESCYFPSTADRHPKLSRLLQVERPSLTGLEHRSGQGTLSRNREILMIGHPVRKSLCGYIELSDCAKVCRGFLRMLGEELLDDLVNSRSLQSSRIRA